MAPKCTEKWDSWINPPDYPPSGDPTDGLITIGAVSGEDFRGTHLKDGKLHDKLKGKCKDKPHHRIHFESEEDGVIYTYDGQIIEFKKKSVIGTRSKRNAKDKKKKLDGDDDVWVGVKST